MVTIGDVFGLVAAIVGIAGSAWALTVACALLYPGRAALAAQKAQGRFWPNLGVGVVTLVPGVVGLALVSGASPLDKLAGLALVFTVLAIGVVGLSGFAQVAAQRLQRMDSSLTDYAAMLRGAGFLVGASLFPIFGWLAVGPILFIASLGCGVRANAFRVVRPPVISGAM